MAKRRKAGSKIAMGILVFIGIVIVLVAGAIGGWYAHAQDWFKLNKGTDEPKGDDSTAVVYSVQDIVEKV